MSRAPKAPDGSDLPRALVARAHAPSAPPIAAIERWWRALDATSQRAVRALCDERGEDVASMFDEVTHEWHTLPIVLRGHFVDPEDARESEAGTTDLLEYIDAHPEIAFWLEERRYHICRAHPAARALLTQRQVPSTFECPFGHTSCPYKRATANANGRTLVLTPHLNLPTISARVGDRS